MWGEGLFVKGDVSQVPDISWKVCDLEWNDNMYQGIENREYSARRCDRHSGLCFEIVKKSVNIREDRQMFRPVE